MQLALFLGLKESYGVSEDTIDQRLIIYMHLGKSFSRTRLRRATEMKTNAADTVCKLTGVRSSRRIFRSHYVIALLYTGWVVGNGKVNSRDKNVTTSSGGQELRPASVLAWSFVFLCVSQRLGF